MTLATLELDYQSPAEAAAAVAEGRTHRPAARHSWRWWARVILVHLIVVAIAAVAAYQGLKLRRYAWDWSGSEKDGQQIHFSISLRNAIDWGQYTIHDVGLRNIYESLVASVGEDGDYREPITPGQRRYGPGREPVAPIALDYPPLRLLIATRWADWADREFPRRARQPLEWRDSYEFNRPMMQANNTAELAGAIAMFLLVRFWIRRSSRKPPPLDPCTGLIPGLLAGLLIWFNPAVIWNAHCFPQWDSWLLAPFLLAVYLALNNRWLVAGLLIGVASMAKGQVFIVLPLLLLWPLLRARPLGPIRMIIGIFLGVAAVASPWLIMDAQSAHWVICVVVAMAVLVPLFFLRKRTRKELIACYIAYAIAAMLCFSPFMFGHQSQGYQYVSLLFGGLALGACFLPRSFIAAWASAGVAAAAFLCVIIFNGSMAWYTIGIEYPTRHWRAFAWEGPTNLGALLQTRWQWEWLDLTNYANYIPFIANPTTQPTRFLLVGIYVIAIALCAIAVAMHIQRRDRRLFYALVAPWVLMFALLPQMLPRYVLWGAAFSSCVAAISVDGFLLYLVLTTISLLNMAKEQLNGLPRVHGELNNPFALHWLPLLNTTYPALGWAIVLLAGIWLCLALIPSRKTRLPRWSFKRSGKVPG